MLSSSGDAFDGCCVGVSGVMTTSSPGASGTLVNIMIAG